MTKREHKYHERNFLIKNNMGFIGIIPTIKRMLSEEANKKFGYPKPINVNNPDLDNLFNF